MELCVWFYVFFTIYERFRLLDVVVLMVVVIKVVKNVLEKVLEENEDLDGEFFFEMSLFISDD